MGSRGHRRGGAAAGGMVAGLAGGVALAAFGVAVSAAQGRDLWLAVKVAAAPVLGDRALQPGPDLEAVLVGAGVHLAVSAGWGLLFGLLFHGASRAATLALGAMWGVVVWLVMFYALLPMVGLGDMARDVPVGLAVVEHLVFGLATAVAYLPSQRRRVRRAMPSVRRATVTP